MKDLSKVYKYPKIGFSKNYVTSNAAGTPSRFRWIEIVFDSNSNYYLKQLVQ